MDQMLWFSGYRVGTIEFTRPNGTTGQNPSQEFFVGYIAMDGVDKNLGKIVDVSGSAFLDAHVSDDKIRFNQIPHGSLPHQGTSYNFTRNNEEIWAGTYNGEELGRGTAYILTATLLPMTLLFLKTGESQ